MSNPGQDDSKMVISYMMLRKAVGVLGMGLPVVMVIGSAVAGETVILPSISEYYYSNMGDVFVGTLCAVALFLFSYKGYERIDDIAGHIACLLALGVAFSPAWSPNPLISSLHFICAALFFMTLAFFSLHLFTKSKGGKTEEKRKRNTVYRVCGWVIIACLVLLAFYYFFRSRLPAQIADFKPLFVLETIALWAFGISWLVKGEIVLADKVK